MNSESKKATFYIFISLALVFAVVLVSFSIKYLGDKSLDYYSSYTNSFKVIKEVYTVQVAFGAVLAFVALLGMIIAGSSTSSSTASRFSNLVMFLIAFMFAIEMVVVRSSAGSSRSSGKDDTIAPTILFFVASVVFVIGFSVGQESVNIIGIIGVLFLIIANLVGADLSVGLNTTDVMFYIVNAGALAHFVVPD